MRLTDDEWVARARARVARGESWESPPGVVLDELAEQVPVRSAAPPAPGTPRCPYCESHPLLEEVRRWEILSAAPLMRCPNCYGFWAARDALSQGVRDSTDDHPSFIAAPAPARCRACSGHLGPDGVCRKCGKPLPLLSCPSCRQTMERTRQRGVTLDTCSRCSGVWFDVGEIGEVYGLKPVQDFPASLVDEHACDNEPPGWAIMLQTILRVIAPFI